MWWRSPIPKVSIIHSLNAHFSSTFSCPSVFTMSHCVQTVRPLLWSSWRPRCRDLSANSSLSRWCPMESHRWVEINRNFPRLSTDLIPSLLFQFKTQGSETEFECHHGPNECLGNKIHSCAIKNIESDSFQSGKTKQSKTVDFINCIMSKSFPDQTFQTEMCGINSEVKNWKAIQECSNSTEGSNLLKENGHLTQALNPELTSVPTILFRNHWDRDIQKRAVVDFQGALCNEINPKPQECSGRNGASNSAVMSVVALVAAFFASLMF